MDFPPSSLGFDFPHFHTTVSHDPSRKLFFAKLIGLTAAAGLAPKLLAKPRTARAQTPAPGLIELRPESRAVARRTDSN